jgi:hypothetical protein
MYRLAGERDTTEGGADGKGGLLHVLSGETSGPAESLPGF